MIRGIVFFVCFVFLSYCFRSCEAQSWREQGLTNPSVFEKDGQYDDR